MTNEYHYMLFFLVVYIIEYFGHLFLKRTFPYLDVLIAQISSFIRRGFFAGVSFLGYTDLSFYFYKYRFFTYNDLSIYELAIVFFILDFGIYWLHRFSHVYKIFWIPHSVHHTPNSLTTLTSSQQSLSGIIIGPIWLIGIPFSLLGVPPKTFLLLFAINMIYQKLLHTELIPKLGPLEVFLNTPAQHRIHHSIKQVHLNKNFGGVFCIFDKMFGTYLLDDSKTEEYGVLPKVVNKHLLTPLFYELNEWKELFQKLKNTNSSKSILKLLFSPPR